MKDKRKIVLVTGSRDWTNRNAIFKALDDECPDIVIHGACPTGADDIAADYAAAGYNMAFDIPMPAQWEKLGKRAGPLRNLDMVKMLDVFRIYGHECTVLAFPIGESHGTRDCMRKAANLGFLIFNLGRSDNG